MNDRYGHAFGDRVLARTAGVIDDCLRGSDLSCRYGGEEFVVLLSGSDCDAAQIAAERIANGIREARFEEWPGFRFSVSIGVTGGIPSSAHSLDTLIHEADTAMYEAKLGGRDRVVTKKHIEEKLETNQ